MKTGHKFTVHKKTVLLGNAQYLYLMWLSGDSSVKLVKLHSREAVPVRGFAIFCQLNCGHLGTWASRLLPGLVEWLQQLGAWKPEHSGSQDQMFLVQLLLFLIQPAIYWMTGGAISQAFHFSTKSLECPGFWTLNTLSCSQNNRIFKVGRNLQKRRYQKPYKNPERLRPPPPFYPPKG